jgi:hypothetical protein
MTYNSNRGRAPRGGEAGIVTAIVAGLALPLSGCVVEQPVPVYVNAPPPAPSPSKFDRSWAAAVGALQDQGVTITTQDRTTGTVKGARGGTGVAANVTTAADGSVRVKFNTSGTASTDPELINRIEQSYERRMGR